MAHFCEQIRWVSGYSPASNEEGSQVNVYPVNPGYDELDGMKCYMSLQDLFGQLAAQFSWMVDALEEELCEVDINPVIVSGDHCIAVDALVIGE